MMMVVVVITVTMTTTTTTIMMIKTRYLQIQSQNVPLQKASVLRTFSQIHQGVWAKLMVSCISSVSVTLVHE